MDQRKSRRLHLATKKYNRALGQLKREQRGIRVADSARAVRSLGIEQDQFAFAIR